MIPNRRFHPDWRDTADVLHESLESCPDCGKHFLDFSSLKVHQGNQHTDCTPSDD